MMNKKNNKKFLIATNKDWNIKDFHKFFGKKNKKFFLVKKRGDFNYKNIKKINPNIIFIPHWSWIIPEKIWKNYTCIIFHMTDLPYGRGGTPLQNLILRGFKKTKISAIKVNEEIDAGDIYIKYPLNLHGSAQEIYERLSNIIFSKMIPIILKKNPKPKKQRGKIVQFRRRSPEESNIQNVKKEKMFDFIRMLDADRYPKAFIETKNYKIEFYNSIRKNGEIITQAKIYEK